MCIWSHKLRKLSTNGDQKENKSFCLTDKPLIASYYGSRLSRWLVCLFPSTKPGRKYALISQCSIDCFTPCACARGKIHAYGNGSKLILHNDTDAKCIWGMKYVCSIVLRYLPIPNQKFKKMTLPLLYFLIAVPSKIIQDQA